MINFIYITSTVTCPDLQRLINTASVRAARISSKIYSDGPWVLSKVHLSSHPQILLMFAHHLWHSEWLRSVSTFNTISPLRHIPMTYSCINWVGRTCISCPYLPLSFLTFPGKMVKKVNGWAIWAWQSMEKWYTKNEENISLVAPKHLIWDIIKCRDGGAPHHPAPQRQCISNKCESPAPQLLPARLHPSSSHHSADSFPAAAVLARASNESSRGLREVL